jgi:hypothetical protein
VFGRYSTWNFLSLQCEQGQFSYFHLLGNTLVGEENFLPFNNEDESCLSLCPRRSGILFDEIDGGREGGGLMGAVGGEMGGYITHSHKDIFASLIGTPCIWWGESIKQITTLNVINPITQLEVGDESARDLLTATQRFVQWFC